MSSTVIEVRGLEYLIRELERRGGGDIIEAFLREIARETSRRAGQLAPRRSGALASSISFTRRGRTSYSVGSSLEYAPYLEFGTRPFIVDSPVYVTGVGWRYIYLHPGIRPRPYLMNAVRLSFHERRSVLNSVLSGSTSK
ncbi:MAG: HK97 gp10 family phage protein [Aigarchaeota archaeon]|nr:HK97 gp10 family phage protein [Aigarchaeota archaeon]MDW8093067.1 HK97 gp10 family phage protein [Nitrososphaerota archaeon]